MTAEPEYAPEQLGPERPSSARMYDYFLGGSRNLRIDRDFAEQVAELAPWLPHAARLNRSFLWRVVRFYLSQGIHQYLDLGSGIPTVGNVHEVAQRQIPDARVVYVDREPIAFNHGRELLAANQHATIIQADIRDPDAILDHPETRELLDLSQPLGLLMVAVMPFIGPDDQPSRLVSTYRQRLATGSYLAISHTTDEHASPLLRQQVARLVSSYGEAARERLHIRTRAQIEEWFHGMELLDPGIVFLPDWKPEDLTEADDPARVLGYGGVARQPHPASGQDATHITA